MRRVRATATATALAVASLIMAGCGTATAQTPAAQKLITVSAAYLPNMQSASALATAIHMGYFREAGLNVKPVQFQTGPSEVDAMTAGQIQFLSVGPGIMFLPMAGHGEYLFSDAISLADSVVGSKTAGVTSPRSLKGKSVLVPKGSTGEVILLETLQSVGLNLSDVTMVNTSPSEEVTAFLTHRAPAMAGWAPITTEVLNKDPSATTVAGDTNFYPQYSLAINWGVGNAYAQQNPKVVKAFVWAMLQAATYRTKHLQQVVGWVSQMSGVPSSLLAETIHQTVWFTGPQIVANYRAGKVSAWMNHFGKVYVEEGLLPHVVPISSYSLGSLVENATK